MKDKAQTREYYREYRIKNKESIRKRQREWYLQHRQLTLGRSAKWKKEHRERSNELSKKAYRKNIEKRRARSNGRAKSWRKNNPELARARDRKSYATHAEKNREYARQYARTRREKDRGKIAERVKERYNRVKNNPEFRARRAASNKKWWYAHLEKNRADSNASAKLMRPQRLQYERTHPEVARRAKNKYKKTAKGKLATIRYSHKRRAIVKSLPMTLTVQEWLDIIAQQGNRCAICKIEFCEGVKATHDHIIPVTKLGPFTKENTQALCGRCNSSKNNKIIGSENNFGRAENLVSAEI